MDFKQFSALNEATKPKQPKVHVFKDYPNFKKVKDLPEGDLYAVVNGDDTFFWYKGEFTINLYPVTHTESFFENSDSNYIEVTIDPSYDTSVDETPYDFNSDSGNIKYHKSLVIDSIDLKASDYKIEVETNDRDASDEEKAEIKQFELLAKSLKAKDIRELFKGDIKDEIGKIIDDQHKEIVEYMNKH